MPASFHLNVAVGVEGFNPEAAPPALPAVAATLEDRFRNKSWITVHGRHVCLYNRLVIVYTGKVGVYIGNVWYTMLRFDEN